MAESKRPGGLTALAVINFVFSAFTALGVVGLVTYLAVADDPEKAKAFHETHLDEVSAAALYASIALGVVRVGLMIAAGVGYLGQKRVLGRTVGSLYGALGLLSIVSDIVALHAPVGIFTIIALIYPVLTLILLNTTFKDDLVN